MTDPLTPEQVAEVARAIHERCDTTITPEQREEWQELCDAGLCGGCVLCFGAPIPLFGKDDVLRLLATVEAQAEVIERTVEWLVAINYGFDFSTDEPLPEPLRRPLAEAWWRRDQVPDAFPDVTVDDYLDLLTEEARWGEVVAPRGDSDE